MKSHQDNPSIRSAELQFTTPLIFVGRLCNLTTAFLTKRLIFELTKVKELTGLNHGTLFFFCSSKETYKSEMYWNWLHFRYNERSLCLNKNELFSLSIERLCSLLSRPKWIHR